MGDFVIGVWKDPKKELPKEAVHADTLWGSQQVLTRKKIKTSTGVERYTYEVCWYMFDSGGYWVIINNQTRFYEPDEWCELEIFA